MMRFPAVKWLARYVITSEPKNYRTRKNRREILSVDDLKKAFGRDKCTMFEMDKYISQYFTKV